MTSRLELGVASTYCSPLLRVSAALAATGTVMRPPRLDGHLVRATDGAMGEELRQKGGEFGATTGRPRRCGWLDMVVLRHAVRVNGLTSIALTKLDVLSGLAEIKVATGYRLGDAILDHLPARRGALAKVQPLYESLPGWTEDLTAVRSWWDLPDTARAYVRRVEQLAGVPVSLLSVGPGREQTIQLREVAPTKREPFTPVHQVLE